TRYDLRELLASIPDLQRLTTRVSTGRASPRDLAGVGRVLRLLPKVKAKVAGRHARLLKELEGRLELCPDLRELLDRGLTDDPAADAQERGALHNARAEGVRRESPDRAGPGARPGAGAVQQAPRPGRGADAPPLEHGRGVGRPRHADGTRGAGRLAPVRSPVP